MKRKEFSKEGEDHWNQSFVLQSYEDEATEEEKRNELKESKSEKNAVTKKVTFKLIKTIGGCESVVTRKSNSAT